MQINFTLWKLALLIAGSGAFGGLVSAIIVKDRHHIDCWNDERHRDIRIRDDVGFFIGRIMMGVAGAMSITFFGILTKFIDSIVDKGDLLFLAGLCVLVGSFSDRLLSSMASRLEREMDIVKQNADDAKAQAKKATETAKNISVITTDYAVAITSAESALRDEDPKNKDPEDITRAIALLERLKPTFPTDRTLYILLGRLYRKDNRLKDGILVLREFIRNLHLDPEDTYASGKTSDCGAAYFNIACYHALMSYSESGDEKKRLEKETLEALSTAISKLADCKKYARTDPDFEKMKGNEEFKKLIAD